MNITAICVVGFVVLGIYKLFELFVKRKERMAIIEKLPAFLNNSEPGGSINLPAITFGRQDYGSWPLRVALLLIGVGLGCVIAFFIQYGMFDSFNGRDMGNWHVRHQIEQTQFILYFSFITIFGGLGLFIAYMIEKKSK
ncbi:MAG: hypothetical protein LBO74_14795 [Candidatus Symbiothrix sp.]|jgi:hypothetical protein|nr:hypothetical protein [Candidatus Symbiothrix sp.]